MNKYLEEAPGLYFASRDDGSVLEVNDAVCAALHFSREELIGQKTDLFLTVATRIFHQTHFFPLLKMHGHAEEIYITLKNKEGDEVPLLVNARRKDFDGEFVSMYQGIIVNNRKKFEEELIAAKKTAENALHENSALLQTKKELEQHSERLDRQILLVKNQNEELLQFNHVITHDMEEPLRKLSIFSDMLNDTNHQEKKELIIEKIARVSRQMKNILSGIQQYVWLNESRVKFVSVNLKEIVASVAKLIRSESPSIEITVNYSGIEVFEGDKEQIRMIFHQLIGNAVRFRQGSSVNVSVEADSLQLNKYKTVEGKYKFVDYLRIKVQDNGVGFDPAYKSKLFELFRKLHKQSGNGVGLALCKKIVENHNGSIEINSQVNKGTIVSMFFPISIPVEDHESRRLSVTN